MCYDMRSGEAKYYDSFNASRGHRDRAIRTLKFMARMLKITFDKSKASVPSGTPQQHYGSGAGVDCGGFVCGFMLQLARAEPLSRITQQSRMRDFRLHMLVSVCKNKLLGDAGS